MLPIIPRLTQDNYKRPKKTVSDKMTAEEIEEKLDEYTRVEDMNDVPVGTHLRYFDTTDGKMLYRPGGNLINKSGLPEYIVLRAVAGTFSVQMKNKIFYRKMSAKEKEVEFNQIISEKDNLIKELQLENKSLIHSLAKKEKECTKLLSMIEELEEINDKLKSKLKKSK